MSDMKKKKKDDASGNKESKKERHIVSWTQEEDDILREQIRIHGTENWSIIASNFKDKTTRQCRRRWFTYLNADFKKGGWTPEEDMLLCEAQKIYGNRWTEIAKVVSGRTDNAVKNRFTTLRKKRAKFEALTKENDAACINSNNKRGLDQNVMNTSGTSECATAAKRMRMSHIPAPFGDRSHKPFGTTISQEIRSPFALLTENICNVNNLSTQSLIRTAKEMANDVSGDKIQGTFLKKDDPKISALMQQAELLSSLARSVNGENTDQSLENAWKVIQDFLDGNKEGNILQDKTSDVHFRLEEFKDIVEELRSREEGSQPSWRQPNLYESPSSSEYSTGSNILPLTSCDKTEQTPSARCETPKLIGPESQTIHTEEKYVSDHDYDLFTIVTNQDQQRNKDGVASTSSSAEFSSPVQVATPLFRTLAAGIPSPQFSESERKFLMKTLGIESPSTNPTRNILPSPPCKRALLHSL